MTNPSSVLFDNNKESWLAVEGNVIRVFTTKTSAIQYRIENQNDSINVLHRYSDGSLEPLMFWTSQELEENDMPLMDIIEEDNGYIEYGYEEDPDFYDLCSGVANDPTIENKE